MIGIISMPANILLLNVHSYCNLGDAAQTEVALDQLRLNFPGCHLTIMIDDPPNYPGAEDTVISLTHWVKLSQHWHILRLARSVLTMLVYVASYRRSGKPLDILGSPELTASLAALVNSDLVVCTPGGYIRSWGKGNTLFMIIYIMALALLARKPLYYLPQSFGPLKRRWELWIIRTLLTRAQLVMAREPVSFQQLIDWGVPPSRCHLFPDLAFAFQPDSGEQARIWLHSLGIDPQADRPLMGVTVVNWGAQNRSFGGQPIYERAVAAAVRDFVQRTQGKVFLLPQCWGPTTMEDDRVPARRVAKLLSDLSEAVILLEHPLTATRLKSIIGQMNICLNTRIHSNVFSISNKTPVVAISYDSTIDSIVQMAGIEQWVVDINRINEKVLVAKLQKLWTERESVIQILTKSTPELYEQACQPGAFLASDYNSLLQKTYDA
jgi:colanic acid/amylovoran biosynthesis protein